MAKPARNVAAVPDNPRGRALVALREMALRGELPLQARIEEVELARTLGTSKPLIRKALEQLELEGLVELEGGHFRVRQFTLTDIRDAITVRGAIEGVAAKLAASRWQDPSELEPARRLHRDIEDAAQVLGRNARPDLEEMAKYGSLNSAFHGAVIDLARSPMLRWLIDRIYAVAFASPSSVIVPPDGTGAQLAISQHAGILNAIASRDGILAESIVREHAQLAARSIEIAVDKRSPSHSDVGLALIENMRGKPRKTARQPAAVAPRVPGPVNPADDTADRVLDAAATLFSAKGYHATTTRELAAVLDIQQASLYHHMASKEDLLYRICKTSMASFVHEVPAALSAATGPEDRLPIFIRTHLRLMTEHYERTKSMVAEFRALSRGHRSELVAMRSAYSQILRAEIVAAQSTRILRTDIPEKYLRLALFNYLNWTPRWFHQTGALQLDELARIYETVFSQGVAAGKRVSEEPFGTASPRKLPGLKARKSSKETLARLISGAAELFSKNGYAATSTREVATFLGMEKASLYYHVRSKEDLLYAICKSSMEALETDVDTALAGVSGAGDQVRMLVIAHCASLLRDQTEHATALAEVRALSPERLNEIVAMRKGHQNRVRRVIESAQKTGELRADLPTRYLGLMLEGLMDRTVVWYSRGDECKPVQLGSYFAELFLHGAQFTGPHA